MVFMSSVGGLIGGLQSSFMRGMTISAKVDGFGTIIPYLYLLVAGLLAAL
jgi:hypothetical protein